MNSDRFNENPAPPLVYAVSSNDKNTFYIEGKRVPHPNVAVAFGNQLLVHAGFDVFGNLSNIPVGQYKLSDIPFFDVLTTFFKTFAKGNS